MSSLFACVSPRRKRMARLEISAPIDVVAEMSLLKSELATANRECIEQKVIIEELTRKLNQLSRASPVPLDEDPYNRQPRNHADREMTLERLKRKQLEVERIKKIVENQTLPKNFNPTSASTPVGMGNEASEEIPTEPSPAVALKIAKSCENMSTVTCDSASSPLTNNNKADEDDMTLKDELAREFRNLQENPISKQKSKSRIYDKLFGSKLKRSSSQDEPFKRNGLRATAGPRLGWKYEEKSNDSPVSTWTNESIITWLRDLGLNKYAFNCKRSSLNGQKLLKSTSSKLYKMMGITNSYHRKKVHLALQAEIHCTKTNMDDMGYRSVSKWLDDIGLPQYQDKFVEARIDGRMLQCLTIEELLGLGVTNALHHLSFRRGIEILRALDFDVSMLIRRDAKNTSDSIVNAEVELWTSHRVMEWLNSIDLSEYSSTLRGSGIHGALMIREPHFGATLFASLLSISASNKTLLRRHLTDKFVSLVGVKRLKQKRDLESTLGFTPITQTSKIKKKGGIFASKRNDLLMEYVCPVNESGAGTGTTIEESCYTIDKVNRAQASSGSIEDITERTEPPPCNDVNGEEDATEEDEQQLSPIKKNDLEG